MRGRSGTGDVTGKVVDTSSNLALERNNVLRPHSGQGAFVVAVQVDEALEGPLFPAGEEPVDGPALVGLQVIFKEALGEVAADRVAGLFITIGTKTLGDELQILHQVFLRPGHTSELNEPVRGIVGEPIHLHDGMIPSRSAGKVLYWLGSNPLFPLWA